MNELRLGNVAPDSPAPDHTVVHHTYDESLRLEFAWPSFWYWVKAGAGVILGAALVAVGWGLLWILMSTAACVAILHHMEH
jgi:hypothetical protein